MVWKLATKIFVAWSYKVYNLWQVVLMVVKMRGYALASIMAHMEELMEKCLDSFNVGESGIVKTVLGEGKIRRRLFDMGITPGAPIYMKKKAPLGDPIEITLRSYSLSLRKIEASNIVMEVRLER